MVGNYSEMKRIAFELVIPCILLIAVEGFSQSTVDLGTTPLSGGQYKSVNNSVQLKPDVSFDNKSEESHSKPGGIVAGTVLISGGMAMGIAGQLLGKRAYHKYIRSAFTDNTNRLHKRVVKYNVMRVAGGICGGTGLFVLIISF
jgi:hypothetical protein